MTEFQVLSDEQITANAEYLNKEIAWFEKIINARLEHYFKHDTHYDINSIKPPSLHKQKSDYAKFLLSKQFKPSERLVAILALLPHIRPELLDTFFLKNEQINRSFTEFGGYQSGNHSGVLPTIETALFVLSANDLAKRLLSLQLFESEQVLLSTGLIKLQYEQKVENPIASAKLLVNPEFVTRFIMGKQQKPNYSVHFPAQLIQSYLEWDDLILHPSTKAELNHIVGWLAQQNTILNTWQLKRHIKPGYRAMFYGPPGTGKSLSAGLLGKQVGMDVYRIDLSSLVSKYIGETEKNLAAVFDQAQQKNWILFFDEADALFGKRSSGSSANDRHSNQEIAYLLQRIESFDGMIVLASNLKSNMDEAFTRRFQSYIYFPMPSASERLALWENMLSKGAIAHQDIDLEQLSQRYEISGGAMTNVIRFAAVHALQQGRRSIQHEDLEKGISRELRKEGKLHS